MENTQQQIQQAQPKIGIAALKGVLNNESIKAKFADMLGKKAPGFITSVINVCSNNSMLANAEANSIVLAAATAAALDLPINPNLGYAAIVPYYDSKKKCTVATFQLQRNAWVELAMRTGQVSKITNELVYDGELVSKNRFTDEYVFDESKRTSDKVIGAMAYIRLVNGFEKTVFWTTEECLAHGKRYSQTFKRGQGLWIENPEAMMLKTVLKNLLVKYAPKSIEMQRAIETDQSSLTGDINDPKPVYVDNPHENEEVVDFEDVSEEQEPVGEAPCPPEEQDGRIHFAEQK